MAALSKATKRPSAEMAGARLAASAWPPAESTLTRTVVTPPGSSKTPFPSASTPQDSGTPASAAMAWSSIRVICRSRNATWSSSDLAIIPWWLSNMPSSA